MRRIRSQLLLRIAFGIFVGISYSQYSILAQQATSTRSTVSRTQNDESGDSHHITQYSEFLRYDEHEDDEDHSLHPYLDRTIPYKVGHAVYDTEEEENDENPNDENDDATRTTTSATTTITTTTTTASVALSQYQRLDVSQRIEYQERINQDLLLSVDVTGVKLHVFGVKQDSIDDDDVATTTTSSSSTSALSTTTTTTTTGKSSSFHSSSSRKKHSQTGPKQQTTSFLFQPRWQRKQPPTETIQRQRRRKKSSTRHLQWEKTYQLVEPLQLELGIPPKHYVDYAYTPVHQGQLPVRTIERQKDSHTTASNLKPSAMLPPKEENTCLAVTNRPINLHGRPTQPTTSSTTTTTTTTTVTTTKTATIVEKESSFSLEEDRRQQDPWWKWWFTTDSPWWRSNQQAEYTTSRMPFAGGSHGQVWKGRRVCDHRTRTSKTTTSSATGQGDDTSSSSNAGTNEDLNDRECDEDKPLILKRLKVEQGYRLLEAGLREVYFGQWIRDLLPEDEGENDLFTIYVDHFFRELPRSDGSKDLELWIVFEDAGPSLRNYIYAPVSSSLGGFVLYQHSPLWAQLRRTTTTTTTSRSEWTKPPNSGDLGTALEATIEVVHSTDRPNNQSRTSGNDSLLLSKQGIGREMLRTVLKQILSAASILHEAGIVHRDIKPSNVMCISDEPLDDLYALSSLPNIRCRLGDFSSGWNDYTNCNLYTNGPSPAEQTDEYAPPEAYIDPQWKPFDERNPQSYDSWSIGVLALELLLGTPNVFSVDQRTTVLLTSKMKKEGASDDDVQHALYLAALSQFCIDVPSPHDKEEHSKWPYRQGDPLYNTEMAKDSCTIQDFHRALRARDPLGIGFDSSIDLLLHLIWQLLAWDPMERITAAEALQHPFFLSPDGTREAFDFIPGRHNALESQMLDPRMDFVLDDTVDTFICPKCGRTFSDWHSCHSHATSRRHAKFCTYDRSRLPSCINTHSMLPAHPTSGYCDLQGRRPTIEDFHSIRLYPEIQFYGIFDGHTGNVASKYVASTLFDRLMLHLPEMGTLVPAHTLGGSHWKQRVEQNVSRAYEETHTRFLDALALIPTMDQSGTTATALIVTKEAIVVSSLGDSRAVLSSTDEGGNLLAIQLTTDHVASNPIEHDLVLERGGRISSSKTGIARVNGTLAITRSIGDVALASMLSRRPQVTTMKRDEIQDLCGSMDNHHLPCFVILASDGLWDVMTNQEAVDMVAEVVKTYNSTNDHMNWNHGGAFQEAAEVLAVDAFVRGSTDNIGVCVVAIT